MRHAPPVTGGILEIPAIGQGKNAKRKRKKHGKTLKVVMTIVLIFVITAAMLLCMAAAYIKNVIIPNAGLEMTAYDLNLTSTILCKTRKQVPIK